MTDDYTKNSEKMFLFLIFAFNALTDASITKHLSLRCKANLLDSYASLESCGVLETSLTHNLEKKCSQQCKQTLITLNTTLSSTCGDEYIYTRFHNHSLAHSSHHSNVNSNLDTLEKLIGNMSISSITNAILKTLPILCLKVGTSYCTKDQTKTQFQKHVTLEKFEETGGWVNWIPGFQSESIVGCNLCTERKGEMVAELFEKESFMERWEESLFRFDEAIGKCRGKESDTSASLNTRSKLIFWLGASVHFIYSIS